MRAQWRQYLHQSWFDRRNTLRGAPFIVMVVLGLLLTFTVIKFSGLIYGTKTLPVTTQMLDMLGGGMSLFRSEEHTSELQSQMRISYADFCLKQKITYIIQVS